MKNKKVLFFIILISIVGVLFLFNYSFALSTGKDLSNFVTVEHWDLIDQFGTPLSTENTALFASRSSLVFNWSLETPAGTTISNGDYFIIPAIKSLEDIPLIFSVTTSSWADIQSSETGEVVGRWRMHNNSIEAIFNELANNQDSISGNFNTGAAMDNRYSGSEARNIMMSFGGIVKEIRFSGLPANILTNRNPHHWGQATTNIVNWSTDLIPGNLLDLATYPLGENFDLDANRHVFYVNSFPSGSVQNINMHISYRAPVDFETGLARTTMLALSSNLITFFNRVDSNYAEYETLEAFKESLSILEYGIYTDSESIEHLVISFGDIGDNGLKLSEIAPNFAIDMANQVIAMGHISSDNFERLVDYFTTIYGPTNIISGHLANIRVQTTVEYDLALSCMNLNNGSEISLPVTNTAHVTRGDITISRDATVSIHTMCGEVIFPARRARLRLVDYHSRNPLSGIEFVLQKRDEYNQWNTYSSWQSGITNVSGYIETSNLSNGRYRFVQKDVYNELYDLSISEGFYEGLGTVISEEFSISSTDTQGQILMLTNRRGSFDVVFRPGECGLFSDDEHIDILLGEAMPDFTGQQNDSGDPIGERECTFLGWQRIEDDNGNIEFIAIWERDEINTPIISGQNRPSLPEIMTNIPNTLANLPTIVYLSGSILIIFGIIILVSSNKKKKNENEELEVI